MEDGVEDARKSTGAFIANGCCWKETWDNVCIDARAISGSRGDGVWGEGSVVSSGVDS